MVLSVILILLGTALTIYGFVVNNSMEAQLESLFDTGNLDPGTPFIIVGIVVLVLGFFLLVVKMNKGNGHWDAGDEAGDAFADEEETLAETVDPFELEEFSQFLDSGVAEQTGGMPENLPGAVFMVSNEIQKAVKREKVMPDQNASAVGNDHSTSVAKAEKRHGTEQVERVERQRTGMSKGLVTIICVSIVCVTVIVLALVAYTVMKNNNLIPYAKQERNVIGEKYVAAESYEPEGYYDMPTHETPTEKNLPSSVDLTTLNYYYKTGSISNAEDIVDTMGNRYNTALSTLTEGTRVWDIGGEYSTLTATVIIRESSKGSSLDYGSDFEIYGDGVLLESRYFITSDTKPFDIAVDISGVTDLEIHMCGQVSPGLDSGVWATLCDVTLHR